MVASASRRAGVSGAALPRDPGPAAPSARRIPESTVRTWASRVGEGWPAAWRVTEMAAELGPVGGVGAGGARRRGELQLRRPPPAPGAAHCLGRQGLMWPRKIRQVGKLDSSIKTEEDRSGTEGRPEGPSTSRGRR